jgi:hypothetical protein
MTLMSKKSCSMCGFMADQRTQVWQGDTNCMRQIRYVSGGAPLCTVCAVWKSFDRMVRLRFRLKHETVKEVTS